MLTTFGPLLLGAAVWYVFLLDWRLLAGAALLSLLGLALPSIWLDIRIHRRRAAFKTGVPALAGVVTERLAADVPVLGALQVARETIRMDHPELAYEVFLTCREIELSCTVPDALQHFARRTGLNRLAAVLVQFHEDGRLESVESYCRNAQPA